MWEIDRESQRATEKRRDTPKALLHSKYHQYLYREGPGDVVVRAKHIAEHECVFVPSQQGTLKSRDSSANAVLLKQVIIDRDNLYNT